MSESTVPTAPKPPAAEDWGVVAGGYTVVAVAALVLTGWLLDVDIFVRVLPGLTPMVFNTAVCLGLLGCCAIFVGMGRARHPAPVAAACLVAVIAGLSGLQYVLSRPLGVDTALFTPGAGVQAGEPAGRMAINSALALGLLALVVLLRARGGRAAGRLALVLASVVVAIAVFAVAGYAGRFHAGFHWGRGTGMAIHTAACLLLLAVLFALDARRLLLGASRMASWALAFCAAGFLLASVSWVAYRGLAQLVEANQAVARTLQFSDHLRQVQLLLAEAERGGRAAPFDASRLEGPLAELAALVRDPEQAGRVRRLAGLARETLAPPAGPDAARGLREEREALVRRILAAEDALLAERQAQGAQAVSEAQAVIVLGLCAAFALAVGGVFLLRRLLRDLRDSRERFVSIFASVAEGLVLQDAGGAILECNAAAERVLGLSAAQLAGRDSMDPRWRAVREDGSPFPGDQHPAMLVLRTGEPRRDHIMGVHRPDGSLVWLSVNAEPVRDSAGRVRAVVTSFFDITERRAAEQALRESEERWKFAIEGTGDGLWDWNAVTNRVFFSSRWKSMLGYADNEIGDSLDEWKNRVHPDDLEETMRTVMDHLEGRTPLYQSEHRVRTKDGSYIWILDRGKVITRTPDGRPLRVIGTHSDLTARRAAEQALRESEERFRNTFVHAGIGMAIVGLDGRWLRVNPALLRILGHAEDALLKMTFQDITHPDDLHADLGQARRLLAGEIVSYQMEKRYFHRDGHIVWIRLTGSLVRDAAGAPVHFVAHIEDITERKQAAEKLAAFAARLGEKNRELRDFAHVASHDLQEPLRKIQAFGDRLDRQAGPRLELEERDYLSRMRAAAARMSALIEALLAYSRVGSQARIFAPAPLSRALQEALQDLELRIERTGGRVEAGPLPEILGDAVQLRQLFQNLVGNALKYHRPEVAPVVRVSAARAPEGALPPGAGPAWEIRVEDNGIGFEPRHAEAIFGVFHRLHGRDRYEGTGVGLAICRRIAERHHGAIRAEGRPGEGAVFIVTLPEAPPADVLDT